MASITISRSGTVILVNAVEDTAQELDTIDFLYQSCWGTGMLQWSPPPYTLLFESSREAIGFVGELCRRLPRAKIVGHECLNL